ncbi:hypothetical protein [Eubacterium sp. MSJ-33]|uniref:hypothetical protein n=1 Tax=Eubacterium sp. MSJ-33 TaxID=2841528 RepID=UPI001C787A34|nr:hypothetical protein [Eubacterium sp. MSJ-33]QWT52607.1 hypothetical protein KP625_11115 [Eubacterium sp. MSJ-33]
MAISDELRRVKTKETTEAIEWTTRYIQQYCVMKCVVEDLKKQSFTLDKNCVSGQFQTKNGAEVQYCFEMGLAAAMAGDAAFVQNYYTEHPEMFDVDNVLINKINIKKKNACQEWNGYCLYNWVLWGNLKNPGHQKFVKLFNTYFSQNPDADCEFLEEQVIRGMGDMVAVEHMLEAVERMKQDFPAIYAFYADASKGGKRAESQLIMPVMEWMTAWYIQKKKNIFISADNIKSIMYFTYDWSRNKRVVDREQEAYLEQVWDRNCDVELAEQFARRKAYISEKEQTEQAGIMRFLECLDQVKSVAKPDHYLSLLNRLWRYLNKDKHSVQKNTDRNIKLRGQYIKIIQDRIRQLYVEGEDVCGYYLKNDMKLHEDLLQEFLFYKKNFSKNGEMILGIRELSNLGMPLEENDYIASLEPYENKPQDQVVQIWKNSKVQIEKPEKLYVYQKKLVGYCNTENLVRAAKCGIFPKEMHARLLDYVIRKEIYQSIYPVIIWIAGGGLDES